MKRVTEGMDPDDEDFDKQTREKMLKSLKKSQRSYLLGKVNQT